MEVLTTLLSPIGKALYLDSSSIQKTRGSVAKVRVQMDITKERPQHAQLGYDEDYLSVGKWQLIQYEDIPDYCAYYKHQGHPITKCMVKKREDDVRKRKEDEIADKKLLKWR